LKSFTTPEPYTSRAEERECIVCLCTALYASAQAGHSTIVELLLEPYTSRARERECIDGLRDALDASAEAGHNNTVELLQSSLATNLAAAESNMARGWVARAELISTNMNASHITKRDSSALENVDNTVAAISRHTSQRLVLPGSPSKHQT
jgi:hypothetical protein